MTRRLLAAPIAAALAVGHIALDAAETAKLRHLTSVYFDDKGAGLKLPEGVGCDGQGNLVIGDTGNDRILRFTYRDKTVKGGAEIKIPDLSAPSRIQLSSKGDIYALDAKRRRIVRFGSDGEFKGAISLEGVPSASAVVPKSFAIDASDNLYVLDVFSGRVLVLKADGQFQRALPLPDETGFASDVAVDAGGTILVLDSIKRRIFTVGKDANLFEPLGASLTDSLLTLPTFMTTTRGVIFVVEGIGSSVVTLGRDGTFVARQLTTGWSEGTLNHPSQMCVNDKDEVFVADRDNSRVQVFGMIR